MAKNTKHTDALPDDLNLRALIAGLMDDLKALRAGKISARDAQARAVLAKHILRGIHYLVLAQKFIDQNMHEVPKIEGKVDRT